MEKFDFNIHLASNVEEEQKLSFEDLKKIYQENLTLYKTSFTNCNFMVFNSEIPLEDISEFKNLIKQDFPKSTITLLYDFKTIRSLKDLKKSGVDFIKFHSYVQEIEERYFQDIVQISQEAQEDDLGILIDTSYGSLGLYSYDNLKLATEIAKVVKKAKIVLLHSGGTRAIEAMLIAMSCENIYLETSFSVPFYLDSTIEKDLAFAYKKLEGKVIYGSDFPYVSFAESQEKTELFFQRNQIEKKDLIYSNSKFYQQH